MNDKSRAIQRRLGGSDATLSELLKKAFVVLVVSETASFAGFIPSWVLLVEILLMTLCALLWFVKDSAVQRRKLY
jgi:hypothetical protein